MRYFENRIPPPLVALTCAALMWATASVSGTARLSSSIQIPAIALCLLVGFSFAGAGIRHFSRAKTTVNPLKPDSASALVTSGIYQLTRNPMYVGMAFILCAWAVFLSSLWATIFIIVFIAFIQRFQIRPEERALESLFGEEFFAYKRSVRPWL